MASLQGKCARIKMENFPMFQTPIGDLSDFCAIALDRIRAVPTAEESFFVMPVEIDDAQERKIEYFEVLPDTERWTLAPKE